MTKTSRGNSSNSVNTIKSHPVSNKRRRVSKLRKVRCSCERQEKQGKWNRFLHLKAHMRESCSAPCVKVNCDTEEISRRNLLEHILRLHPEDVVPNLNMLIDLLVFDLPDHLVQILRDCEAPI